MTIDPYSSSGTSNWVVDGAAVLSQQWFWYRINPSDGVIGQTREYSIDTISTPVTKAVDANFDVGDDRALIRYTNATLTIQVVYNLAGGGLGTLVSDIAEQISIVNRSGSELRLSFFQYSNFNLGSSDQINLTNGLQTARQTSSFGRAVGETVNTPAASSGEAALNGVTLSKLQDSDIDNLDGTLSAGPGDVTWALQWDFVLTASGPGSEIQISKDKQVTNVPEPTVALISVIGGLSLMLRRRRVTP